MNSGKFINPFPDSISLQTGKVSKANRRSRSSRRIRTSLADICKPLVWRQKQEEEEVGDDEEGVRQFDGYEWAG